MRIVITSLIGNLSRSQCGHPQQFLRLVDTDLCQIFFEGLAGSLAEYRTKMAGAEICTGSHIIQRQVRICVMLLQILFCLTDQVLMLTIRTTVSIRQSNGKNLKSLFPQLFDRFNV